MIEWRLLKHDKFVVCVVDPESAIAEGLSILFETYGIEVLSFPDAESFLEAIPLIRNSHCCLIIEANLPGISAPALLQEMHDEFADLWMFLLISTSSPQLLEAAQSSRQISVIEKPCTNGQLVEKVLEVRQRA